MNTKVENPSVDNQPNLQAGIAARFAQVAGMFLLQAVILFLSCRPPRLALGVGLFGDLPRECINQRHDHASCQSRDHR